MYFCLIISIKWQSKDTHLSPSSGIIMFSQFCHHRNLCFYSLRFHDTFASFLSLKLVSAQCHYMDEKNLPLWSEIEKKDMCH